jgi:hypothetical protein
VLIKILDGTAHGKDLKNSSRINRLEIQKIDEMYRIQNELKEAKEEIKKKGEELSKIISLN